MEIAVKNLTKSFKGIKILNNVNIIFKSKKIIALVGRNGSGKSVLLKLLCGLYLPTEGEILFDNINYNLNDEYSYLIRDIKNNDVFENFFNYYLQFINEDVYVSEGLSKAVINTTNNDAVRLIVISIGVLFGLLVLSFIINKIKVSTIIRDFLVNLFIITPPLFYYISIV